MSEKANEIELFEGDYVVMLRPTFEFLKFSDGEIIIYSTLKAAHDDAQLVNGTTSNCSSMFEYKKEQLKENIKKYRMIRERMQNN